MDAVQLDCSWIGKHNRDTKAKTRDTGQAIVENTLSTTDRMLYTQQLQTYNDKKCVLKQ